jgi:HSP20 family protein
MVEKAHSAGWFPGLYEPLRAASQKVADWFAPPSEAAATANAYVIKAELPGVGADDIDVSVHDGVLTMKGEKKSTREEKGETWFFSEREYGSFARSFRLPPDADQDAVEADFRDGVLTIRVAKRGPEEPARRKVQINRG